MMNTMLSEIMEMPAMAANFLEKSVDYSLPNGVPYLGMGSSYFAPLSFKYMGIDIQPEPASEFYHYLKKSTIKSGVLLSQSGRSTELLWCARLFEEYIAITNYNDSPLCQFKAVSKVVPLLAGDEQYSSSKTYINTLLALFKGFGMDVRNAVALLAKNMNTYEEKGRALAEATFEVLQQKDTTGIYILGSGPNIGTAMQAALIMSESTKLVFTGMPMAQYDHGPKETAKGSIVIQVVSKGRSYDRSIHLSDTVSAAGAKVFAVEEPDSPENESILHNIIPFNFMAYYLSQKLKIGETFVVGGKVTEVNLL